MSACVAVAQPLDFPFDAPRASCGAESVSEAVCAALRVNPVRRRAALDIGSGTTKLLVADVDVAAARCSDLLLAREVPVLYGVDSKRTAGGCLSEEVQLRGIAVLRRLLDEARELQVESVVAVATEVFRRAPNGASFVERVQRELELPVCVVDQAVEAMLGFRTAAALATIPPEELVMWDCGGGSFQLVAAAPCRTPGKLNMHLGSLGDSVATATLLRIQGKDPAATPSPNPVSLPQAELLMQALRKEIQEAPEWLYGSKSVVAIGGRNSMFFLLADMLRDGLLGDGFSVGLDQDGAPASCTFGASAPRAALELVAGCGEEELARRWCWRENSDPPGMVLPKLCLIAATMERLGLASVQWRRTVGSTAGIVVSERGALGATHA